MLADTMYEMSRNIIWLMLAIAFSDHCKIYCEIFEAPDDWVKITNVWSKSSNLTIEC